MQAANALIHEFNKQGPPIMDDDGDQMLGFYYQFTDAEDHAIAGLIGPYRKRVEAEHAARRAFEAHDF
jgi:hypothetical protein